MLTWQKMPYRSLISLLRARSRLQSDPERHQKPKVKLPLTFVVIDKIAYRRAQLCHFWGFCFWLITNRVILSSRILSLFGFTIAFQCFLNASARVPFGPEVLYWWYAKTVQCFKLTLKILSGRRSTNKCETFICTWWVLKRKRLKLLFIFSARQRSPILRDTQLSHFYYYYYYSLFQC